MLIIHTFSIKVISIVSTSYHVLCSNDLGPIYRVASVLVFPYRNNAFCPTTEIKQMNVSSLLNMQSIVLKQTVRTKVLESCTEA